MLEEAVASLRAGQAAEDMTDTWSPLISLGASVLIPESYVPDLNIRMALYRRLSQLDDTSSIDSFAQQPQALFKPHQVRRREDASAVARLAQD